MAELLKLPKNPSTPLAIGGAAADEYFRKLSKTVGRQPRDAGFAVYGDAVQVVPARDGLEVNVPQAARAIVRAATRPTNRVAQLAVVRAAPERSTADALAMGIDRRMSSYKTYYSGTADRITNLQLGVEALDGTLVAPGGTFSLNDAIGERTSRAWVQDRSRHHRQRVLRGSRRRDLAGRDHGLQRRVGGGAPDHRATSAFALHQPVSARP